MNKSNVQNALRRFSDRIAAREGEIRRHSSQRDADSDDEVDSECPIMDSFYSEGGNQAIKTMTNLNAPELRLLYGKFHEFIVTNWNVVRGRKSSYKPMDMLFMLLTTVKHGGP